jgi:hypothetical protein
MNNSTTHEDPAAIEKDIRRTQEDMSRTVDKIGDQLTIKSLVNGLLDKADENGVDAHYLIDGARRNPIALGLIAAGAIWLVSDKDSKFPSTGRRSKRGESDESDFDASDVHHRDYVAHMSSLEIREGEDPTAYQRRRDQHRATFLMCERGPDEDESGFRQRLDDLTEKFREKRRAWTDSASHAGTATGQKTRQIASQATSKAQEMYGSNPLVGGILAAAVGAALGSTIPVSRQEQEKLGRVGAKAREAASEQKDQLTSKAMEKKDELLERADEKLQQSGSHRQGQPGQSRQSEPAFSTGGSQDRGGSGQQSSSDEPFILTDRTS